MNKPRTGAVVAKHCMDCGCHYGDNRKGGRPGRCPGCAKKHKKLYNQRYNAEHLGLKKAPEPKQSPAAPAAPAAPADVVHWEDHRLVGSPGPAAAGDLLDCGERLYGMKLDLEAMRMPIEKRPKCVWKPDPKFGQKLEAA